MDTRKLFSDSVELMLTLAGLVAVVGALVLVGYVVTSSVRHTLHKRALTFQKEGDSSGSVTAPALPASRPESDTL